MLTRLDAQFWVRVMVGVLFSLCVLSFAVAARAATSSVPSAEASPAE